MADVSVLNVPDEVIARLREQAAGEGVSLSEWIRLALTDRATLPTPTELAARQTRSAVTSERREEFDRYYRARLHRRSA